MWHKLQLKCKVIPVRIKALKYSFEIVLKLLTVVKLRYNVMSIEVLYVVF